MASGKGGGGVVGFLFGGPIGAAVGLACGHLLDSAGNSKGKLKYYLNKRDISVMSLPTGPERRQRASCPPLL